MSKTESGIYSVNLKIQVDKRQRQQWVRTSLHAYFKFVAHAWAELALFWCEIYSNKSRYTDIKI